MKNVEMSERTTQHGKWIWYPDDFEIELSAKFMKKRYERDVFIPVFWRQEHCWRNVKFVKTAVVSQAEYVKIEAEGKFNIQLDGQYVYNFKGELLVPVGEHQIVVSVYNDEGLPTMRAEGSTIVSDDSWLVTCNDHQYKHAAYDDALVSKKCTPNTIHLPVREVRPTKKYEKFGKTIYDFGKELFAYVRVLGGNLKDGGTIFYGESEEEATDWENCELITRLPAASGAFYETDNPKAFRYLTTDLKEPLELVALDEYLPKKQQSSFHSSDPLLDQIYQTALETLSLTTREFIIDGIKRDRWVWSADASQGYLMHYYSYFDKDAIKRTMIALYGREPFDLHLNHIMDYTFFWIISFCDYYDYTGDRAFISQNLTKAVSALDYCISRTNENGLMEGKEGDWVFVDWADGLDNRGEVCFEQILYAVSLQKLSSLLKTFGEMAQADKYETLYHALVLKLERFWNDEKGAYIHSIKNGVQDGQVLRYANIFMILYDLCDEERQAKITENVLKSDLVPAITTPYMRFFELSALMKRKEREYVMNTIDSYWGGMLNEGATTFWETYDARQTGAEKYAMYGRKYGKSLCHAWGASPLYLIGRYVIGVTPTKDGKEFIIQPDLVTLEYFSAKLPLTSGYVEVSVARDRVEVFSDKMYGELIWKGKRYRISSGIKLSVKEEI